MSSFPSKSELSQLTDYLLLVADRIPNGLTSLKDTVTFVCMDLRIYIHQGIITQSFTKALDFARTVPRVDDLHSDSFIEWMLNDREHMKYF